MKELIFIRQGIYTILALELCPFVGCFALCNDIEKGGPVLNNNKRVLKFLAVISLQTSYIPVTVYETQFKSRGISE